MATKHLSQMVQQLRRAVLLQDGAGLTDGQLLACFIEHRDEAAFANLIKRHGPMVWGVCRRLLRNHHDAEDAFQATFLVLVRKAACIMPREMVANWLYGVAHQTALKARQTAAKRRAREMQVTEMPEPAVTEQDLWPDLQPLLDQELSRLPDNYRVVIVLCDLEGKTRKDTARQLGLPEGTVASRLTRARMMLAKRLAQRGVVLSGGALTAALSQNAASSCVPTSVVSSTIKAASLFAAGQAAVTGVISIKVAALTEGVLKSMLLTKLKTAMAGLLVALVLAGVGAGGLLHRTQADEPSKVAEKKEKPTEIEDEAKVVIDKVVKAHGGEERLKNLKAFTMKVKTAVRDIDRREYHCFVHLPDRARIEREFEIKGKAGKIITVCNGDKWWTKTADGEIREGKGKEIAEAFRFMGPRGVLRLTDPSMKVSLLGEKEVGDDASVFGDRVAICIDLARKDGKELTHHVPDLIGSRKEEVKEVKLYFGKDNGLLLKEEFQRKVKDEFQQDKDSTVEFFYSDYKLFNGIPVAQKMIRRVGGQVGYRTEIEFNIVDNLEANLFQRP